MTLLSLKPNFSVRSHVADNSDYTEESLFNGSEQGHPKRGVKSLKLIIPLDYKTVLQSAM